MVRRAPGAGCCRCPWFWVVRDCCVRNTGQPLTFRRQMVPWESCKLLGSLPAGNLGAWLVHNWRWFGRRASHVLSSQPTDIPFLVPCLQLKVGYKNRNIPNSGGLSICSRRHSHSELRQAFLRKTMSSLWLIAWERSLFKPQIKTAVCV